MKTIENATFETLATIKTFTIFDLRTYIVDRVTTDDNKPLFTLASAEIRTPSACIEFITENKLYKNGNGNGARKVNDDATIRNRTETIDRVSALATGAPDGFELVADSIAVKTTHDGARVHFDVYGKRLFTLFVQNKHVNIAVKLERLNNYIKYNDGGALPFTTEFKPDDIGDLSYGKDCKFVHNVSFDTVTVNQLTDENGNAKTDDNGAPLYETIVTDGNVYKFVLNMLVLYGAIIPTETPDNSTDGNETNDGTETPTAETSETPTETTATETTNDDDTKAKPTGKAKTGNAKSSENAKNNRTRAK